MQHELGYFGNIWVRQNTLEHAGMTGGGHHHYFDHVSLLAKGKVRVSIDGQEPKEFTAPTFIVIRAECSHEIVALEDDTVYYCVFALRDINGEVIEPIFGEQHDPNPNSSEATDKQYWDRKKLIENI